MCFAYHVFHKQTSFIFKPEKYPMYFFSIMIHLMVISGCLCFVSTLSSHSSKFSARARRYIYLGYSIGIKGHRFYITIPRLFLRLEMLSSTKVFFLFNLRLLLVLLMIHLLSLFLLMMSVPNISLHHSDNLNSSTSPNISIDPSIN